MSPPILSPRLLNALAALLAATAAVAADPTPAGSTVPSDPVFSALMTDATTASGRIRQLGPDGALTLVVEGGNERTIPLGKLVKLTREGTASPSAVEGPFAGRREGSTVLFPDGDRLRAAVGSSGEATLEVQSFALGDVKVPTNRMLGLVLAPPSDDEALEALLLKIREEPRTSEVLWLTNGDRLSGGFLGLGPQKVAFQPETGKVELERAGVVALGFEPALVEYPRPKGTFLELTLADGSRLGASDARIERGNLVATARLGATIKVPIAELSRVHVRSDSVSYLSDRTDAVAVYEPYVGPSRPYRRDANVEGRPIHLSGQTFDHGLGTQSRTLLAYKLRPGDRRFQATVGLDDRAGPLGNVVFKVLVNRKDAFVSPPMAARGTPVAIDVDVAGATSLILITEFGERGEVRDLADWAEARLVR